MEEITKRRDLEIRGNENSILPNSSVNEIGSIRRIDSKGNLVSTDMIWEPTFKNGKLDGIIPIYDENHSLVAMLSFQEGLLSGLSKFYKKGELHEQRTYQNNVQEGWSCIVDDDQHAVWYTYKQGQCVSQFEDEDMEGYRKEIDVSTGWTVSIGQYDENHCPYGIFYQFEKNEISKVFIVDHGVERVLLQFENNTMSELDASGSLVYQGNYLAESEEVYLRNGTGKEFKNKGIAYIGEWKNGKREGTGCSYASDRILYSGYWKEGFPHGNGQLLDETGSVVYEGLWNEGLFKNDSIEYQYPTALEGAKQMESVVTETTNLEADEGKDTIIEEDLSKETKSQRNWVRIGVFCFLLLLLILMIPLVIFYRYSNTTHIISNKQQFDALGNSIRYIVFPSNSCNEEEFTELDLSRFHNLVTVTVGDDCFENVNHVSIQGLSNLKRVSIGTNDFGSKFNTSLEDKSFELKDCPQLENVSINRFSFSTYNQFNVESILTCDLIIRFTCIEYACDRKYRKEFLQLLQCFSSFNKLNSFTLFNRSEPIRELTDWL